MAQYYIGFDCGTMGTKVAIFTADGTMVADAYRPHVIDYPQPGWAEMEADQFLRVVKEGLRECMKKSRVSPREIRAISCSGIICGFVPIDEDWNPVGPYFPYLDNRAKDEAIFVSKNLEPLWETENGTSIVGAFIPPMILRWLLKNEKGMMGQARKVVEGAHYVLGKLGGLKARDAFIDFSHLSGWLLGYDGRSRNWSPRQLDILGIPLEILPRVVKPWDVVGRLTREAAEETGLTAGIPLVAGGGDMQQSCLGSGVIDAGVCSDVAGTASNFSFAVSDFSASVTRRKELMVAMHTLDDIYLYWAIIPGGGLSLRWFRDDILQQKDDEGFYARMDKAARAVAPGSAASLFLPYLQGRTNPVWPNASAGWLGLYGSADSAVLWRAMLESIAYEYYGWVRVLAEEGIRPTRIVGQGGGSKGSLWNQIKADVLNAEYVTLKREEQAVLGNALLAAYGVGDITNLRESARKWVEYKESFPPDSSRHKRYMGLYEIREKIINGPLSEVFDMLAEMQTLSHG
jgi:xylulokinase